MDKTNKKETETKRDTMNKREEREGEREEEELPRNRNGVDRLQPESRDIPWNVQDILSITG